MKDHNSKSSKKKQAPKKPKLSPKSFDPDVTKLKRPEPIVWGNLLEMYGWKSSTGKEVQEIARAKKRLNRWRESLKPAD